MLFSLPAIAQRTVYVFAPDTIVFSYADNKKTQHKLRITEVPDSSVCLYFSANNTIVKKCIPEGVEDLAYELRPGNRQQPGLWYRGAFSDAGANEIKYHPATVSTVHVIVANTKIEKTPEIAKNIEEDAVEEVVSIAQTTHSEFNETEAITTDTTASVEEEKEVHTDVWEAVKSAEFEFDRVRLFRDYFEKNGCDKESVFRALDILRYDPSRLELLRSMVSFCESELQPHKKDIADTFFTYPHFRQQLLQLFTP